MNTVAISDLPAFDAAAFAAHTLSSPANLAAVLDHTLLKPEATRSQVLTLCAEAAEHRFACAMVNPTWVSTAVHALAGTGVPVGVVIGFPLGATLSSSKRDETVRVLKLGAHDVDMVLNVGLLKSGQKEDFEAVRQDIRGVVDLAHAAGAIVKVILETCLLTFEEKLRSLRPCPLRRGRLPQDKHRLLDRRSHDRRHRSATRRRWKSRRRKGLRRHPLAG